jgi:hypothetical protein
MPSIEWPAARRGTAKRSPQLWASIGIVLPHGWLPTLWGGDQALQYDGPRPRRARRMTDTALTALKEHLRAPAGGASYGHIRTGLAEQHQVQLSYSSVYAVVRGERRAKPKRPRPSHEKKSGRREGVSHRLADQTHRTARG